MYGVRAWAHLVNHDHRRPRLRSCIGLGLDYGVADGDFGMMMQMVDMPKI